MKTKNKILALLEITIVLCSVLLVATLPAAAITNYESGITNYEETTSEDETLGIYGNANEDDTIDMRDLTYVKLIFFGKKTVTELADAKYDGKINPLDFIQIKLIIVGKEKEITLIDSADRIVTVSMPLNRLVVINGQTIEVIRSLKATDRIVGVDKYTLTHDTFFPELQDLPNVGASCMTEPDYEAILALQPDAVFIYASPETYVPDEVEGKLEDFDITVIRFDFFIPATMIDEVKKLGYILGQRGEADEFVDFYEGHMNTIKERTEGLSEEDKPSVYFEWVYFMYGVNYCKYNTCGGGSAWDTKIEIAGGKNIFSDLKGNPVVDAEAVAYRNPEIIFGGVMLNKEGKSITGYDEDDIILLKEPMEEIMSRLELKNVSAVTNEKVYMVENTIFDGPSHFVGIGYLAKIFHHDLFPDLDPQAIHQEYLDRFQCIDFDVYDGIWVYPEIS